MKRTSIASQLLKGYLIIMALILILIVFSYVTYNTYSISRLEQTGIDMYDLMNDIHLDKSSIVKKYDFAPGDAVIITDKSYNVIDTINYNGNENSFFNIDSDIVYENNSAYYVFEGEYDDYVYHLYLSPLEDDFLLIGLVSLFTILLLTLMSFMYARRNSNKIIHPIHALSKGVKNIAAGNYDYQIDYTTNTELDDIRNDINTMSQKLKEETKKRELLEHERNELIMSLSHDIKTPLTNIIGYSQALSEEELDPRIKQSVDTIYRYGLIAAELTDELFDYAKIEHLKNFDTVRADIVEVTRLKLIEYVNEFEKLNIDYNFVLPEQALYTNLNVLMYHRVLDNLIQNAIQYNNKDFDLYISISSTNEKISISIKDSGIGIPLEYHSMIFDPMVRVEGSRNRQHGGTGLGLSITKKIMLNHKGSIRLDSAYTNGCHFIIELPKI